MKIVALDTFVTDFDGLEWKGFSELGEFSKFDSSTAEESLERAKSAEAIIVNKVLVNTSLLEAAKNLKYVGVTATGVNNIDLAAVKDKGVVVANVPGYSTNSVAEIVFAYIHDYYSKVSINSSANHLKAWVSGKYFSFLKQPTTELAGKSIGVIGYGAIGKQVAKLAAAYQMKVSVAALPGRTYSDNNRISLDELLESSDIVTLHCPLTEETSQLVDKDFLKKMKPTAVLVNTARGPLVNEADLAEGLVNGELAHAYLDVLCQEPTPADNPLLALDNVTITPHIAWATREARQRLIQESYLNLQAFLTGQGRNLV